MIIALTMMIFRFLKTEVFETNATTTDMNTAVIPPPPVVVAEPDAASVNPIDAGSTNEANVAVPAEGSRRSRRKDLEDQPRELGLERRTDPSTIVSRQSADPRGSQEKPVDNDERRVENNCSILGGTNYGDQNFNCPRN
jgi:hypothetical protein